MRSRTISHKFYILFLAVFIPLFLYSLGYEVYRYFAATYPLPVSWVVYRLLGQNLASLIICGLIALIVVQFARHKQEISPYVLITVGLVQAFLIGLSIVTVVLRPYGRFTGLALNQFLQLAVSIIYALFVYAQTRKSDKNYGVDEMIESINAEKE